MKETYYIYHIPTYVYKDGKVGKVGATEHDDLKTRMRINMRSSQQPFDFWEVLEQHTDIMIASQREIELQKQYGYTVDRIPYWQSRKMGKSGAGGRVAVESGQLASIRTKENQIKGGRNNSKENKSKAGKIGGKANRKLTFEDAQTIRELYSKKQYNQPQLAKMYNVSRVLITMITLNKRYKEL